MKSLTLVKALCYLVLGGSLLDMGKTEAEASFQPSDELGLILEIDDVWAGHIVGFELLTHGDQQFVGYYNADRQMVIAQRQLGSSEWVKHHLDSYVGWDSHNYITISVDLNGFLHVVGNVHVDPLVYFRSTRPLDVSSLQGVHRMIGEREDRVTYPTFLTGPDGGLVFSYRDGSSGDGITLFNAYDHERGEWRRLISEPLLDGLGQMNAYPIGPLIGEDGYYHMSWVWRDTLHAETNHSLSYARSADLVNWQTAGGQPLVLPLTPYTQGVMVDPIPPKGGIINGSGQIGFDGDSRVVISYHKFDEEGNTQLYFARFEEGAWKIRQATNWNYRWYPSGGGSIEMEVRHGPLIMHQGNPAIHVRHVKYGAGLYEVDPETFALGWPMPAAPNPVPHYYRQVSSTFPEMRVVWKSEKGSENDDVRYRLRWEALPAYRDAARPKPWPEPSKLKLFVLESN
jgi:hypothetical protein